MDDLQLEVDLIYKAVSEKFDGNTQMTLRKVNQEKRYGIWYARMACMMANQNRVLVAIVPLEEFHAEGSTAPLSVMRWIGLQTRETTDPTLLNSGLGLQNCPTRPNLTSLSSQALRTAQFKLAYKGDAAWTYVSDQLPSLRVDLLKEKRDSTFRESGTAEQMLDTYCCAFSFQLQP